MPSEFIAMLVESGTTYELYTVNRNHIVTIYPVSEGRTRISFSTGSATTVNCSYKELHNALQRHETVLPSAAKIFDQL